ncbi:MAG: hypothetical protein KGH72_00880 [Candidatus Micrarchaeota archaeon]|nr:hypothetical protein [Candidatus Micrarchaeota archaeon]
MADEPTFLDLVCIMQIGQDTTLEKFGSTINASIFDASNIAGTLKHKALIDFTSYFPGPNIIVVSDAGKLVLNEAQAKATEPFDPLDETILWQLSGGKRIPSELQAALNLNPKDLALHLYKVNSQGFISYDLKSGNVELLLTEKGFIKAQEKRRLSAQMPPTAGGTQPPAAPAPKLQAPSSMPQPQTAAQPPPQDTPGQAAMPQQPKAASRIPMMAAAAILLVIVIVVLAYMLKIV